MNKQWRIVGLGDYANYYSYFTGGILHGAAECGAWFRPVSLFGQSLQAVKDQVNFFKPHIILAHMIFNKKPHDRDHVFEMLRGFRKDGIKICYHMGDARKLPRYEGDISEIVDMGLVNNSIFDKFSKIWNVPCYHWPYGCMPQNDILNYNSVPNIYKCVVGFTGSLSTNPNHVHFGRTRFVNTLEDNGIEIRTFPNSETGNTRFQTAEMATGADRILGFGMGEDIDGYLDVRPFQYIGAGAVYTHNISAAMDKFFVSGIHYIAYRDVNDFINKLRYGPRMVESIRRQGFEFCQKHHSMKARVQFILDLFDGKVDKPKIYLEDVEK